MLSFSWSVFRAGHQNFLSVSVRGRMKSLRVWVPRNFSPHSGRQNPNFFLVWHRNRRCVETSCDRS